MIAALLSHCMKPVHDHADFTYTYNGISILTTRTDQKLIDCGILRRSLTYLLKNLPSRKNIEPQENNELVIIDPCKASILMYSSHKSKGCCQNTSL